MRQFGHRRALSAIGVSHISRKIGGRPITPQLHEQIHSGRNDDGTRRERGVLFRMAGRALLRCARRELSYILAFAVILAYASLAAGQSASSGASSSGAATSQHSGSATAANQSSTTASSAEPAGGTDTTGPIAFIEYQGSASPLGAVMALDVDLGYHLTEHITGDIGIPFLMVRSPFSPVITHDFLWTGAMGEPYLDFRYTTKYHDVNYMGVLTGTAPFVNEDRIYSTGRAGVDFFNHVDESFGAFTPFLNVGASNGAVNRFVMPRPYTEARPYQTLGFLSDYEGGASYKFHMKFLKGISIGGSAYALLPAGPQKVFSRLVQPYSSLAGDSDHGRDFNSTFETTGNSKIARDNGYSGWVDILQYQPFDLQLGYTHSVHYKLDTYTVTLTFNARQLVRDITGH
jgi:hypothetical protein